MTDTEKFQFECLVNDVEGAAADCRNFGENLASFAKRQNFKLFQERYARALEIAERLPYRLGELKRFVDAHPELHRE